VEGVCRNHSLRTLQALATRELALIMLLLFMVVIVMVVVLTSVMVTAIIAMWDTEGGTCDY
jgi:hypothetical protein